MDEFLTVDESNASIHPNHSLLCFPSPDASKMFSTKNQFWIESIELDFNAKKIENFALRASVIFSYLDGPAAVFILWGPFVFYYIHWRAKEVSILPVKSWERRGGSVVATSLGLQCKGALTFTLQTLTAFYFDQIDLFLLRMYAQLCTARSVHTDCVSFAVQSMMLYGSNDGEIRFCSVWHYDNCMMKKKNCSKCFAILLLCSITFCTREFNGMWWNAYWSKVCNSLDTHHQKKCGKKSTSLTSQHNFISKFFLSNSKCFGMCVTKNIQIVFKSMTFESFERQTIDSKSFFEKCFFRMQIIHFVRFWLGEVIFCFACHCAATTTPSSFAHFGCCSQRFSQLLSIAFTNNNAFHIFFYLFSRVVLLAFVCILQLFLFRSSSDGLLYIFQLCSHPQLINFRFVCMFR